MKIIKVPKNNIIMQGITHYPWSSHRFIVYFHEYKNEMHIDVNAYFHETENGFYECLMYYNRHLCNNLEELRQMTFDDIERQAYGAYMDGAR
ncbi:MAG: hypothetical protein K2H19_08640, partial [Ruminococcus sp.]|nr:hypothetical protein [Ruminococcus sp.]